MLPALHLFHLQTMHMMKEQETVIPCHHYLCSHQHQTIAKQNSVFVDQDGYPLAYFPSISHSESESFSDDRSRVGVTF